MPKTDLQIEKISALAELERLGWKYEPLSEHEFRCKCPVHDDSQPSVNINIQKNLWNCKAAQCNARGDIISLLCHIAKVERSTMIVELSKRYDLSEIKVINPELVEKYHAEIWGAHAMLAELRKRGVTPDMIRDARLGYYDGRITIPIFDRSHNCVNIRRYLPGAPGPEKMRNSKGYGDPKIYQPDQFKYETIWFCGGEMKALVAKHLLNPHSIGAIAVTAGEGAFKWEEMAPHFKGKHVYVCMDVDLGGMQASTRIAKQLFYTAQSVWVVELPLDKTKHPKGDINDYVGQEHATDKDLLDCMTQHSKRFYPTKAEDEKPPETVIIPLHEATLSKHIGKAIEVEAVVTAMDDTPYLVPSVVGISCTRDQPGCVDCPVKAMEPDPATGYCVLTIKGTSPALLKMINAPVDKQKDAIKEGLKIPPCKTCNHHIREYYNVVDARLTPQLNVSSDSTSHVVQPALVIGHGLECNTPYVFTGRVFPHPKTQQAVLLMHDKRQAEDNLTNFAPKDEELQDLEIFRPEEWTYDSLKRKLVEIYSDLETNVTRIFKRLDLHLAIDLCYHSPLMFEFDKRISNGWVNLLILGDTSQGKSECMSRMLQFYNLGEIFEVKNSSSAGIIGGLQKIGDRWFISWGVIPTHDRRLVVLEEVKGLPTEAIGRLTGMRSSGIAEVSRIEKRKTFARTRLIFISNARSQRELAAYNFGVEAIKELIGGLEDVRRFDLAVLVSKQQVNPEEINRLSTDRPEVPHKYTSVLCRRAILWAWTRKVNQIHFDEDATTLVLSKSIELCKKYTEAMPLVDQGSMRYKIARLAAALAIRTFSTADHSVQDVRVRSCHVEFVCKFIDKQYSSDVFGYLSFSQAQEAAFQLVDPGIIKSFLKKTKFPKDFVEQMLYQDEITLNDICDWCASDRDDGMTVLSLLVRKHALLRNKNFYVKTSKFIELLKQMKVEGLPTAAEEDKQEVM